MALSIGSKDHASPNNLIDSASSPKPHASSSRQVLERSLKELGEVTYYTDLSTQGSGKALSFNDMGLDQLHDLAAQEENDAEDGSKVSNSKTRPYLAVNAAGRIKSKTAGSSILIKDRKDGNLIEMLFGI
jgi:hypothetical protein